MPELRRNVTFNSGPEALGKIEGDLGFQSWIIAIEDENAGESNGF